MDAGLEQYLVRVEVAYAGQHLLVHKRRFDAPTCSSEAFPEGDGVHLQRVGAELSVPQEVLRFPDEVHLSEHPRVVEGEVVAVLEGEEQAAVRGLVVGVLEVCQASGHAEVHEHPPADVELYEQVLAVTAGGLESVSFQGALQLAGGDGAEDFFVVHLDVAYHLVQ